MLAMWILQPLLLLGAASAAIPPFPPHLVGNASAVAALLERVVPGASAHFEFEIVPAAAAGAKNPLPSRTPATARSRSPARRRPS